MSLTSRTVRMRAHHLRPGPRRTSPAEAAVASAPITAVSGMRPCMAAVRSSLIAQRYTASQCHASASGPGVYAQAG